MKKLFFLFIIYFLLPSCSEKLKESITLKQKISVEHVDNLGNGQYEVYFSYRWIDGHTIGTGIMTDQLMGIGDEKTYVEYEKENEYGQKESGRRLEN